LVLGDAAQRDDTRIRHPDRAADYIKEKY